MSLHTTMISTKNLKALRLCVTLLMLGCMIFGAVLPVAAVSYPKPDNKVADEAKVLSESTVRSIQKANQDLTDVGASIAVCTVKTTGDTKIDEYARGLFKDWKLGEGVLLLIAVDDENYFFVQSVGVDKIITNEVLATVRDSSLEEDFAAGNIDRGVLKTVSRLSMLLVSALENTVSDEGDENTDTDEETDADENKGTTFGSVIVGIFKFILVLVLIVVVLFAALFAAALFNDDCAEIFSNIWQNFILRKGRNSKKTYSMPSEYYDERLYGNRPQNAQRRPNPNNSNANRRPPQYGQNRQPNRPQSQSGQNRPQNPQYNGQARRNQYYNADGTPRQPRSNQNQQNRQNGYRQNPNDQQNAANQYGAQFGDETRQFTIPGRGQNQR